MKRYHEYTDSGVEWIGQVPKEWDVSAIRRFCQVKRGASPRPIDDQKYFDDNGEFAWVRIADVSSSSKFLYQTTQTLSELGSSLSVKKYPDELFLSIAGTVGKPIIAKIKCCIHDGFVYFENLTLYHEFLYYIFFSGRPYLGLGKWGTQLNLNTDTIANIKIPVPPYNDQVLIASFLDYKTQQIDDLIAKKQKLIELLKEERTAIINQAVTKGLDTAVPLRDSGIEWLGEIPEQWDLRKIGRSFRIIGSGTTPAAGREEFYENGNVPWVLTGDLNDEYLSQTSKSVTEKAFEEHSALKKFPAGSLVIAMYGATIGRLSILQIEATTNQACCVLGDSNFFNIKFLFFWFLSNRNNVISLSYGGGQPNISQEIIRSIKVPCPSLKEQSEIVRYLDHRCNSIDISISHIEKEIQLISDYKTSLINEVVTGKIDVRNYETK
jgi:type I restriction enzyme, S subunit